MEGYAVGIEAKRGHKSTPIKKRSTHVVVSKRNALIREVMGDVAGVTPYERRVGEMIKIERYKSALRYLKKRLGNFKRASIKRDQIAKAVLKH